MCRNSSSGSLVLTKLGMKIPGKQKGRGSRMEEVGSIVGSWVGAQEWEDMLFTVQQSI